MMYRLKTQISAAVYVLCVSVLLTGCAASGPKFVKAKKTPKGKSLLYVYRPSQLCGSGVKIIASLNGMRLVNLKNGGYSLGNIIPGFYRFEAKDDLNGWYDAITVNVEPKKPTYVKINPCFGIVVMQQTEREAQKEIKNTRLEKTFILPEKMFAPAVTTSTPITLPSLKNPKITSIPMSDREAAVVVPVSTLGNISKTQKQIVYNALLEALSTRFRLVPEDQYEQALTQAFEELEYEECTESQCFALIQQILQTENLFVLQLVRDGPDTQITLQWVDLNARTVKNNFCEGCGTRELNQAVKALLAEMLEKR
jgi:hypothetical protein